MFNGIRMTTEVFETSLCHLGKSGFQTFASLTGNDNDDDDDNNNYKKYVLWNAGISPIASKVGHVTLATPHLGSFIVPYVVLAMAYPTKKKRRVYLHSFKSYGVRGPKI